MPQTPRSTKTRWAVRAADRVSAVCITVGGVGSILAVSAVFVFLASVALPLFLPGKADSVGLVDAAYMRRAVAIGTDEYRVIGWSLAGDGLARSFRLDTGETLATFAPVRADSVARVALDLESNAVAIARRDGSVVLARIRFDTEFAGVEAQSTRVPPSGSPPGDVDGVSPRAALQDFTSVITDRDGVVQWTADGGRRQSLRLQVEAEVTFSPGLRDVDVAGDGSSFVLAGITEADSLVVCRVQRDENEFTGESVMSTRRGACVLPRPGAEHVVVAEAGTAIYAVAGDGRATVVDVRNLEAPRVVASASMLAEDARVTAIAPLLGRTTVVVGASDGSVATWFRYTPDGGVASALSCSRRYPGDGSPVVALAASQRARVFIAGESSGRVRVLQATSGKGVIDLALEDGPVTAVAFAPKNDAMLVLTQKLLHQYTVDFGHPEATLGALFGPVRYEGYGHAEHVWQSSAGTDDFEPKLGLWPLVFGTLKATFYSLLFGVPLALLGAIFTSEFVSPSVRPRVKTLVESMASLPSVVLGFLAALVIAPFVQRAVPSVVAALLIIPTALLACGYLTQLLPAATARRVGRYRLLFMLAVLPVAVAIARVVGPWMERTWFGGDTMSWLAGRQGGAFGGWLLLLLPFSAAGVVLLLARVTGERVRELATRLSRGRVAWIDLGRFVFAGLATVGLAAAVAGALTSVGLDPRGSLVDTYVQRNALVVGFVMGFAIIPIIYTIAEDALSAVPQHLRAASLGAGATPWQTAIRIVLPTAMSGLFSAVMIGLGRAVGETMIVLMAAGNTPVLEMNVFNGFRTLSANIAVELPEAVRNSTHYRTLFLAALILFVMTFVVNTVAEIVRMRFRKRSAQI